MLGEGKPKSYNELTIYKKCILIKCKQRSDYTYMQSGLVFIVHFRSLGEDEGRKRSRL